MSERKIINGHALKEPRDCPGESCTYHDRGGEGCPVCSGGLGICIHCGAAEIELDTWCRYAKTLFIFRSDEIAQMMRHVLPRDRFDTCSQHQALAGRRYETVVVACIPDNLEMLNIWRTKLPPGGKLLRLL